MAMAIDSFAVTAFFPLPILASPSSSVAGAKISLERLLEFKGLRMSPIPATRSRGSVTQRHNSSLRSDRQRLVVCEAQERALEAPAVTDSTWRPLVLESDSPVLVEFWAPWCGPCRLIHPIIDELAKEYAGKLRCYKVNTDECPSTSARYGIKSVPTIMIFKNGERQDSVIGAVPKSTLTKCIERFL